MKSKSKNLIAVVGADKIGKSSSIVNLFNTLSSMNNAVVVNRLYPKQGKIQSDVVATVKLTIDDNKDILVGIISLGDVDKVVSGYIQQLMKAHCDTIIFACHQNFMDNSKHTASFQSKGYNYITTSCLHNNYAPRLAISKTPSHMTNSIVSNVDLNSIFSQNVIYLINQLYK